LARATLFSYNDELVKRLQQKKSLIEVELENAKDELKTLENQLENAEAKIQSLSARLDISVQCDLRKS
jgi:predicted  nucleic acid-binding Zn-ribbon protein